MTPSQKSAIIGYYRSGATNEEIAEMMNSYPGIIEVIVLRYLEKINDKKLVV